MRKKILVAWFKFVFQIKTLYHQNFNRERVIKPDAVRDVLSLLHSCGFYEYSGQFAFKVIRSFALIQPRLKLGTSLDYLGGLVWDGWIKQKFFDLLPAKCFFYQFHRPTNDSEVVGSIPATEKLKDETNLENCPISRIQWSSFVSWMRGCGFDSNCFRTISTHPWS